MRARKPLVWVLWATLGAFGCDDTSIASAPPDVGFAPQDGGISGPLPIEVGMSFTYQGRLTARDDALGNQERTSLYRMTLTITAIDEGAGTLSFSVTGANQLRDDWTDPYDFSSWVGRVGPSLGDDQVGNQEVTIDLVAAPMAPGRQNPKVLPTAGPFFFDIRQIEAIRAEFSNAYAGSQPTVTDPSNANGRWRFTFTSDDPSIITYNQQRRQMTLEYDARGVLREMIEVLGEINNPPSGDHRLVLQ